MRIKKIELAWFRGAADAIVLEPDSKSMVIYGENGSGKSSFVDAVEYVLSKGSIEHLKTEYSGTRQEKAVPNTQRPLDAKTTLRFTFKEDSELNVDFDSNGTSKSSGAQAIAMQDWQYRQTVLRQNEVSEFIHDTKGEKYSALLPLFGLSNMEFAAENLRKLARSVGDEAKVSENKIKLKQVQSQREDTFGTKSFDDIVASVEKLYGKYCEGSFDSSNALQLCSEIEIAIDNKISGSSAEDRKHFLLRGVAESLFCDRLQAARSASVDLAASAEPLITERLQVLRAAVSFLDGLDPTEKVNCPACGRSIVVESFRDHVTAETSRLQEVDNTYSTYKAAINALCTSLDSLKADLKRPDLEGWRESRKDPVFLGGIELLDKTNTHLLRDSCSDADLIGLEQKLLPLIAVADLDSKASPPEFTELTEEKRLAGAAKYLISNAGLEESVSKDDSLVTILSSLETAVRSEIRKQAEQVISNISQDIETMWAILHPDEKIDSVRLLLSPSADKAIDVILKFHGLEQDSPRLTLSEGFRNSLGLCVFLAMAKQVADIERPLFLDDVVVSLDRNHRGMIQELLEKEFSNRQVIIFTHDREWYMELRHQLGDYNNRWGFVSLLPYETPSVGIRLSHKTSTFDEARALIEEHPASAGNDARKIMDIELSMIAERIRVRMPYFRSERNDQRMAHDFLMRFVSDGKRCFEIKSGDNYISYDSAIETFQRADQLLVSWGNRASHSFNIVPTEAEKLIDACESAIASFNCNACERRLWFTDSSSSEWVQCQCGHIRWRYGKA